MDCEPMRIHVDPKAKPQAVHRPTQVPIHWKEPVSAQLKKDLARGVIDKVPMGVPSVWQARMVLATKEDGSPRRTVDLSYLNKHCDRETQPVVTPYKQARIVPANTYKTVCDADDGYHAVPLHVDDRKYTMFVTEEGRFQYRVIPQGFSASGDAYNQRFDRLIEDMERKTKNMDDVLLWDEGLAAHWWRVLDFPELCGNNGITLNVKKFQFCSREVQFSGFVISEENFKPMPKYLDAIRKFPQPQNITEIRSWFGLIN